jgi:hypothetical protein
MWAQNTVDFLLQDEQARHKGGHIQSRKFPDRHKRNIVLRDMTEFCEALLFFQKFRSYFSPNKK